MNSRIMVKNLTEKICTSLSLIYADKVEENTTIWLSSQNTLRKLVGILGMSLPFLLYITLLINSDVSKPLESISHYYFTRASSVFIMVISFIAIFMFIYKGYSLQDFIVSSIAGISALLLLFFPTNNLSVCFQNDNCMCCDSFESGAITFIPHQKSISIMLHYICSGVYLASLAYMSIFIFTKSNSLKTNTRLTPQKKVRNKIYRICGYIMIAALVTILLGTNRIILKNSYSSLHLTFWLETMAIECFGISWLIKGEMFIKDAPNIKKH